MCFGVSFFPCESFCDVIFTFVVNTFTPDLLALEKTEGHAGLGLKCINDQLSG